MGQRSEFEIISKMIKHFAVAIATAQLIVFALVGCYEPVSLTWYEAGVYKGAPDPMLEVDDREDLRQALRDRLRAVQTDR